ncbi:hypothetical protein ThimaDRAFT_4866 [Thiocapsa marina 5811]|uniref:Uncharacterized protein n=1 Tax=Thiocapsa marina 5811 TaxID=768671 RepID=F9UIW3_9GAMM|nr:hypothetical protein ThimaDRAFT_4866 [Thiocapsa marina 5811]
MTKLKEEKEKLRIQLDKLLRQVEAYHLLEDLYAHELSEKDGKKAVKTIKTEYRNKIVEVHQCVRPKMTANEAKKYLQDLTH